MLGNSSVMRLLKIGVYYSAYLEQFYARCPNLASEAYSVQHAALMDDCFGSANFWTAALNNLGYETCDIVANAEPMQTMWAKEQGLKFDQSHWLFDITAAQIKAFRPDVLLVADYSTLTAVFLRHLKDICPSIRLVLGWCGAPFQDGSIFYECDIVLSCVPELVSRFQENGHRSRHINHAFDPRVLRKIDVRAPTNADFVFLGSLVKSDQFHIGRERILSKLIRETDLRIWSDAGQQSSSAQQRSTPFSVPAGNDKRAVAGFRPSQWRRYLSAVPLLAPIIRRASRLILGGLDQSASPTVDHDVRLRSNPPLFGLNMFQQLHDSRVALNTHIDISTFNASNMRLFEATGVGTCLLTDWKSNLSGLFELDSEVVAYRDEDECVEKVEYLLGHDSERRCIAAAGQRRTLRDHSFAHRAAQLDGVIFEALT
ncbi:MAG: glycosyltransferase [Pyrinomonadaceae bacterium]|nr:glycosyltransferase [Pyrinomonadaceae bacterium]